MNWACSTTKTVQQRFADALATGKPVTWTVNSGAFGPQTYTGPWRFSTGAGDVATRFAGSGTDFSSDDGIWGAGNGLINADAGTSPSGVEANIQWGHGNFDGSDTADRLYQNGTISAPLAGFKNLMYTGDAPAFVSEGVAPASVSEDGAGTLTYTFLRSGNLTDPLTVNFSAGGTAGASRDYVVSGAASFNTGTGAGTVTFAAGSSTATVTVSPTDDAVVQDETVGLAVETGTDYAVGWPASATGTITNDDAATIDITDVSMTEGNSGTKTYTFTATLSAVVDAVVSVNYITADNTATTGDADYVGTSGTLTFPANGGWPGSVVQRDGQWRPVHGGR